MYKATVRNEYKIIKNAVHTDMNGTKRNVPIYPGEEAIVDYTDSLQEDIDKGIFSLLRKEIPRANTPKDEEKKVEKKKEEVIVSKKKNNKEDK